MNKNDINDGHSPKIKKKNETLINYWIKFHYPLWKRLLLRAIERERKGERKKIVKKTLANSVIIVLGIRGINDKFFYPFLIWLLLFNWDLYSILKPYYSVWRIFFSSTIKKMNEFETWIKMHTLDMISKHIFFLC